MIRRRLVWTACSVSVLALGAAANLAVAQTVVVPDTKVGVGLGSTFTQSGSKSFTIDGGTLSGVNLFHSFSQFDVGSGDVVTWAHAAGNAAGIHNVINRVTGGTQSSINGTLQSSLPNADFYFINPAGIVFGAGSQLNLPNAVYFSTASELRFADKAKFSAATPSGSVLTSAAPAAFGFLGGERGMSVDQLTASSNLSLSASNITFDGSTSTRGRLDAVGTQSGQVLLGNPLDGVPVSGSLRIDGNLSTNGANIKAGTVDVGGLFQSTADITIHASALNVSAGSQVSTSTSSSADAGNITLNANTVGLRYGGGISSSTYGKGKAGTVTVNANSLTLDGGKDRALSSINSDAHSSGAAGEIDLNIKGELQLLNGTTIESRTYGSGNGGQVNVRAQGITLQESNFTASTYGAGNAGTVLVKAATIDDIGGNIASNANPGSTGKAGSVTVNADDSLTIEKNGAIQGISQNADAGGGITINSDRIDIRSGGAISSTTMGAGKAGMVTVNANSLTLDGGPKRTLSSINSDTHGSGDAGEIDLNINGELQLLNGTTIESRSYGSGDGGQVNVWAQDITLQESNFTASTYGSGNAGTVSVKAADIYDIGGNIASNANPGSTGKAGGVIVTADDELSISDNGAIQSNSEDANASGGITIDSGEIYIEDGGSISSTTLGAGRASAITINADRLVLEKIFYQSNAQSTINSDTRGSGHAGEIDLNIAGDLNLFDASTVESRSYGSGDGGKVNVSAGNVGLYNSNLTASTYASGNAGTVSVVAGTIEDIGGNIASNSKTGTGGQSGNVSVTAHDSLTLDYGGQIQALSESARAGGDITIDAPMISIYGSGLPIGSSQPNAGITASSAAGKAGNITINHGGEIYLENGGSIVSASINPDGTRGTGNGGTITITAKDVDLDGGPGFAPSTINTDTGGKGSGGQIKLDLTGELTMAEGTTIESRTYGSGAAGQVMVSAKAVTIMGSNITSSTFGAGDAGTTSVTADTIDISGQGNNSGLIASNSRTATAGKAGTVSVVTHDTLTLHDQGLIETNSANENPAGNISVTASHIVIAGSDQLRSQGTDDHTNDNADTGIFSNSSGAAGAISLALTNGGDLILDGIGRPGTISTSSLDHTGGQIHIDGAGAVIMRNGHIEALGPDDEADVQIHSPVIRSSEQPNALAVAGKLTLDPTIDVGASVTAVDLSYTDASGVLSGQCAAQQAGARVSQLATIASGPYVAMSANAGSGAIASLAPVLGDCGRVTNRAATARGIQIASDEPSSLLPDMAVSSPVDGNVVVAQASDMLRPRTGPNAGAPSAPAFAVPDRAHSGAPPALPPTVVPALSDGDVAINDIKVSVTRVPFVAPARTGWRPQQEEGELSLDAQSGENLDGAWVKKQFQRNHLIGAKVPVDRIVQLVLLINRAYIQNGYINTGILLTGLPARGGVVEFALVAGHVLSDDASGRAAAVRWGNGGAQGLSENYVRARLPAAQAVPFNAVEFEREFRLLSSDSAIQTINADLRPGRRPGEADLTVLVDPAPRFDLYAAAANSRSPSVGGYRAAIGGSGRNLAIDGDLLSGEFGITEGLFDGTLDYATPSIYPDILFDIRAEADSAAVVDPALRALDIRSREATIEGGLSYQAIQEPLSPTGTENDWSPAELLTVGLRVAHRVSTSYLLGLPFSFTPGAVNGSSHFTVARGTLDWSQRNVDRVWDVSATTSVGLEGTGSDIANVAEPSRNFVSLFAHADLAQRLTDDGLEMRLHTAGQWSRSLLYSPERFSIGGEGTVSGYRENLLLADRGALFSAELNCPVDIMEMPCSQPAQERDAFKVAVFTAGAFAENQSDPQPARKWLASIGTSLSWTPAPYFLAKISYAKALVAVPISGPHDLQDDGVNFQVTLHPLSLFDAEL